MSGIFAILFAAGVGIVTVLAAVAWAPIYGLAMFLGVPFFIGLLTTLACASLPGRTLGGTIGMSLLALLLAGSSLLFLRIEGLMCLAMALPLAAPFTILGAISGHYAVRGRRVASPMMMIAILATPSLTAIERAAQLVPPLLRVESSIDVDAPPEAVWKHVVEFSELPAPTEWFFRTGIAYPVRATIDGRGPGAIRKCEFTTGPFVEPIEVWDAPKLLRFAVTQNPAPMEEWTPYGAIHPPHLKGFLVSERGQFQLAALAGGRTRLTGTTWYRHNMWPASYWQWWSDAIIHRIHLRVLKHVRTLAENQRTAGTTLSPLFSGRSTGSATRSPSVRP